MVNQGMGCFYGCFGINRQDVDGSLRKIPVKVAYNKCSLIQIKSRNLMGYIYNVNPG